MVWKKHKLKKLWLSYNEKTDYEISNPINWENCTCCILNFPLDVTSKKPKVQAKIWAILIFFIIKEHKSIRNVLNEDNLKKADVLKTLSAYY